MAHRAALLSAKTWHSGDGGTKRQRAQLTASNNLLCPSFRRSPPPRGRGGSEITRRVLDLRSKTKHRGGTAPLGQSLPACATRLCCAERARRVYEHGTIWTEAK